MAGISFPNEVFSKILSKFLSTDDFLNCRRVCKAWNKECLRLLENSKCTQFLTNDNIPGCLQNYVEFISSVEAPQLVLPFHIDVSLRDSLVPTSTKVEEDLAEISEMELVLVEGNIRALIEKFGPGCVSSLTLSSQSLPLDHFNKFLPILGLVCEDLKDLYLDTYYGSDSTVDFGSNADQLYFPNLKKFEAYDLIFYLFDFFIQRAPNLKHLRIEAPLYYDWDHVTSSFGVIPFETLSEFCLNCYYLTSDDQSILLQYIRNRIAKAPPVLRGLCLGPMADLGPGNEVGEILAAFSKSLEYLTVSLWEDGLHFCLISPLTSLGRLRIIKNSESDEVVFINPGPEFFNMTPETLPALFSMDIYVNTFFLPAPAIRTCKTQVEIQVTYPSVTELTLRIDDEFVPHPYDHMGSFKVNPAWTGAATIFPRIPMQQFVEHLFYVFPNVNRLSLANESAGERAGYFGYLIFEVLQSNISLKIKELVVTSVPIDMGSPNFLWRVLERIAEDKRIVVNGVEVEADKSEDHHKMRNVEKIRLHQMTVGEIDKSLRAKHGLHFPDITAEESTVVKIDMKLISMAEYFPSLHYLEISRTMFGNDPASAVKQIEDVNAKFFHLTATFI